MYLLSLTVILSILRPVALRWCGKESTISQLDQLKALNTAMLQCFSDISKPRNYSGIVCRGHFDGVMCWQDTRAGETATQVCPSYIHGFNTSGYAVKECLDNGEWYFHPLLNKTYTNFTACIPNTVLTLNEPTRVELIQIHMPTLQVLYRIGYSVSMVFLVVAVVVMTTLSKLRCERNTIHINLFISFILRCIVCFVKDEYGIPEGESNVMEDVLRQLTSSQESWRCKLVHTLFFYILMANYVWVFAEGIYLHSLIFVTTFHNVSPRVFKLLIAFGWVSPMLCIVPWIIVRVKFENTLCWNLHDPEMGFHWIIEGPIICTLMINFLFFLNIVRVLFTKLSASHSRDPKCYRKLAKSTLVLIPLFGVHYIVFIAMPICLEPNVEIVWMYLELIFSSFQGFVVSLLFCFFNGEVKTEIRKHWRLQTLRRQSLVSTRSTRTFSIQSTTLGKDQDSPKFKDKRNSTTTTLIRPINSCASWGKDNAHYESTDTDLRRNVSDLPCSDDLELSTRIKDDNENVAFLKSQKVTFF